VRAPAGGLSVGAPADVCVLEPDTRWRYDATKGQSKSRNSPWDGQQLTGRVRATVVAGRLVYHVERGVLWP